MQLDNHLIRIVKINEDIKSIVRLARKVNILALNAILLSRKAGALAVGFGVIADELRSFSKSLTNTMQELMSISYDTIQVVSQNQRITHKNRLLKATLDNLELEQLHQRQLRITNTVNVAATFRGLHTLLIQADEDSRFGSVIARSLKIEATYGKEYANILSQIANDFSDDIDKIPTILDRISHCLQDS